MKEGKGGKESGSDSDDDHSGEDESHDEEDKDKHTTVASSSSTIVINKPAAKGVTTKFFSAEGAEGASPYMTIISTYMNYNQRCHKIYSPST